MTDPEGQETRSFKPDDKIIFSFEYDQEKKLNTYLNVRILDSFGRETITIDAPAQQAGKSKRFVFSFGAVPAAGEYRISLICADRLKEHIYLYLRSCASFTVNAA